MDTSGSKAFLIVVDGRLDIAQRRASKRYCVSAASASSEGWKSLLLFISVFDSIKAIASML
jgi:hypothetical protein